MKRTGMTEYRTRDGEAAENVFMELHKSIMDRDVDAAVSAAFRLYRTSSGMVSELWKHLETEAVYHIGLKEPGALSYIYNLRCICYDTEPYMPEAGGMQALCLIHGIRYLCGCDKEEALEEVIRQIKKDEQDGVYAVIPPFAKDHHNHEGRNEGHTPLDFLYPDGGSKVIPEAEGAQIYKERLIELLSPIYGGKDPKPFTVNQYNPFYERTSPHGLNQEMMQSAFQKTIRRAMEQEALRLTYEGFLCGKEMEDYLWERIVIMSIEDIGMGEPECSRFIYAYYKIREQFEDQDEVRLAFLMQAVRILCRYPKERGTELIKGILVQTYKNSGDLKQNKKGE